EQDVTAQAAFDELALVLDATELARARHDGSSQRGALARVSEAPHAHVFERPFDDEPDLLARLALAHLEQLTVGHGHFQLALVRELEEALERVLGGKERARDLAE